MPERFQSARLVFYFFDGLSEIDALFISTREAINGHGDGNGRGFCFWGALLSQSSAASWTVVARNGSSRELQSVAGLHQDQCICFNSVDYIPTYPTYIVGQITYICDKFLRLDITRPNSWIPRE